MKRLITGLLSALFIWAIPVQAAPAHINNSTDSTEVQQTTTQLTPSASDEVSQKSAKEVEPEQLPEPETVEVEQHPVGCENYSHIVQQYDWNTNVALAICQAESSGNPLAVGDDYPIAGLHAPSCGLYQVRTLVGRPDCESLKDPATNIAWAHSIYLGQGWNAWSVCRTKVSCY